MIVHTAEKYAQENCIFPCANCCLTFLSEITFSPLRKLQGLEMYWTMNDHHIR